MGEARGSWRSTTFLLVNEQLIPDGSGGEFRFQVLLDLIDGGDLRDNLQYDRRWGPP